MLVDELDHKLPSISWLTHGYKFVSWTDERVQAVPERSSNQLLDPANESQMYA